MTRRTPTWWAVCVGASGRPIALTGIEDADRFVDVAMVGPGCPRADVNRFVGSTRALERLAVLAFRSRDDAESFAAADAGRIVPLNEWACDEMLSRIGHLMWARARRVEGGRR